MSPGILNKKCGIITVSIKNNGKKIYSFNCWFCDTIFLQMKKFGTHLEQNHESHLETYNEVVEDVDFTPEIELEENCLKSEDEEEPHVFTKTTGKQTQISSPFRDPLDVVDNDIVHTEKLINISPSTDDGAVANMPLDHDGREKIVLDAALQPICTYEEYANKEHLNSSQDENTSSDGDESDDENSITSLENEVIVTLLEAFEKHPIFWGTLHTIKYRLNEKPKLLQKMIDKLNQQLKIKLKYNVAKKTLIYLCQQYEASVVAELTQSSVLREEQKPKQWFHNNMEFMRNAVIHRFYQKSAQTKVKPLKDDQLCDLIDIYKKFNCLWNVKNLAYPIKEKRQEALQLMLEETNDKLQLTLTVSKLKKHLVYLHRVYAKDKRRRLEYENTQQIFKPSFSLYEKCDFLDENQGPFRCSTCKKIIEKEKDFKIHQSLHDGSLPFVCPDCGMGFKKKSYYSTHVKRHLGFFKFHCEICGKGYPFNAELEEHMRSHTGAQPFLCSICGEGFGRASTYDNHIRRHEERFKYFCEICKKGFNCKTRLKDHVKAHLNVRDCVCSVCGKTFTSRRYLSQHKRIHVAKNFICNICGKGFGNEIGLRSHRIYHESSRTLKGGMKKPNKIK